MMLSIRTETGFEDKEIDVNSITYFAKMPYKLWNKNGTFKKFTYSYSIRCKSNNENFTYRFYSHIGKDSSWNNLIKGMKARNLLSNYTKTKIMGE